MENSKEHKSQLQFNSDRHLAQISKESSKSGNTDLLAECIVADINITNLKEAVDFLNNRIVQKKANIKLLNQEFNNLIAKRKLYSRLLKESYNTSEVKL